ncbi:MAG TPA: hypothetical protein VN193_15635 [Candidatus Angelobacter sp.]|nr:hypothetical protein [Candidatus Angelobacter sp.]
MRSLRRAPWILVASTLLAAALPAIPAPAAADNWSVDLSTTWTPPPPDGWAGHGVDPTNPQACDPIDPAQCMLPYPNDWLTRPDQTSDTGRRLDLNALAMPRNAQGKPIEPQEWNRSDGFSAGAQILTVVPGMTSNADLAPSGLPPVTNLAANTQSNPGVVLLDVNTGRHVPVWVEIDQYTQEAGVVQTGSVQQDLMVHPAVNLTDGHRYIVALRHLVTNSGATAQPSAAFRAYRDGTAPLTDPRRAHMENVFSTLRRAGVQRSNLYLAWDFTTASTKNVTGRLLAMRDGAFAQLGDTTLGDGRISGSAPSFSVDSSTDFTPAQNGDVARRVTGHFTVPCYIAPTCEPPTKCGALTQNIFATCPTPGQFALDPTNPDATPAQVPGQTYSANFICNVGRPAFDNHRKLRPVEYGHGLFGGAGEVNSDAETSMARRFDMMYCATDWFGMATADVPNAVIALTDMSRFPLLTDRVQEGELAFLYLARLMVHPQGFSSNAAFKWSDGTSFIDTRQPFYDGNSQGGIYGGTVCAVSVDVRRCVLGVPGMNYSILLPRSSDYVANKPLSQFDPTTFSPSDPTGQIGYSNVFDTAYPDQSQRMLVLDLIQTLWDRSDPNGYASHMVAGLPNTPTHHVLLQPGYGDHQVANITAETEARTIGAHGLYPPLVAARYGPYHDVFWNIPQISSFPYDGSAITLFDTGPVRGANPDGTNPPPTSDTPNRSGSDPHEAPRRAPWGQVQKSAFLSGGGRVTNPQPGGAPYFAWGWDGVSGL